MLKPFAKPARIRISREPREKIYVFVYLRKHYAVVSALCTAGSLFGARTDAQILLIPGGRTR